MGRSRQQINLEESNQAYWSERRLKELRKQGIAPIIIIQGQEQLPANVVDVRVRDGENQDVHAIKQSIELDTGDLALSTDFMLINVSDTATWPHSDALGVVHIYHLDISVTESSSYRGKVAIGYLKNVDGTDGDFVEVLGWDFQQASAAVNEDINFNDPVHMSDEHHLGTVTANDTAFETTANLAGPAGSSTPSGNRDVVMRVIRTAGNVEVDIFMQYEVFD